MEPEHRASLPMPDIRAQKRELRRSCRQIRKEMGEAVRQQASLSICGWIEAWPLFQRSSVILAYMPIPGEVDLTPLLVRQSQKRWVLPRIIPEEDHRMVFHPYEPARLVHHPFGMAEPAPDLPIIPPNEVELALVPGVAFDRLGRRLGYGGGYFDRFLRDFTGVALGVIYQALLLDQLPYGEHDVPVGWVVTEAGLLHTNPQVRPVLTRS
jgi:5-formyltetrahydrofolate cyclo-ligase